MNRSRFIKFALSFVGAVAIGAAALGSAQAAASEPVTVATSAGSTESIVFSGGCFWGVQAVFQHVKGVKSAISGYAGGEQSTADYETVSGGRTGHAESVQVVYDPAVVPLNTLLNVFFSVAHDPTELNRQGPDVGTQYRSAIFYSTPAQQAAVQAYIAKLSTSGVYKQPIVTKVDPLRGFYRAEAYHQDYARLHPNEPYIFFNDRPKVANLKSRFPELYNDG